jgi:hypothetical protein
MFESQSTIGWNQILKGRFCKEWSLAISQTHEVSSRWISYAIRIIWQEVYNIWKIRCHSNHGDNPCEKQARFIQQITHQVTQLYAEIGNIDSQDHYIYKHTQEELLSLPTHSIKNWVHTAKIRIKDSIYRMKQKAKTKLKQVHTFFTRQNAGQVAKPKQRKAQQRILSNKHKQASPQSILTFFKPIPPLIVTSFVSQHSNLNIKINIDLYPP